MRALVLDPSGTLTLASRPRPALPSECVIRVAAAGICGTDLELRRGYAGFAGVPGHEFVGVVDEAPAPDAAWIGRRVTGEITVGCGACHGCRAAGRGHCDRRSVLGIIGRDGAFAEYLSLPAVNLHAVPDAVSDEAAVLVEPLAAACRVLEQIAVTPQTVCAVVGPGRLGLLVALVLRAAGARVTVIGRGAARLALARSSGFDTAAADATDIAPRQFDVVVDATGRPEGLTIAKRLVRPRGTIVMKSTFHGEARLALAPLVVDEITLVGSRCGPFDAALDLLAAGRVDVRPLVDATYPLDRFAEAFEAAEQGRKVILRPQV
ncbi:MAG TPA: alcohol dehydrogenase catalytic domain-containing protein [Vicinamibacterales bacterium]|nr:alcohol dehydrogenase catalytic domain-containing protein [Vicinamibacterales bacterium]